MIYIVYVNEFQDSAYSCKIDLIATTNAKFAKNATNLLNSYRTENSRFIDYLKDLQLKKEVVFDKILSIMDGDVKNANTFWENCIVKLITNDDYFEFDRRTEFLTEELPEI